MIDMILEWCGVAILLGIISSGIWGIITTKQNNVSNPYMPGDPFYWMIWDSCSYDDYSNEDYHDGHIDF